MWTVWCPFVRIELYAKYRVNKARAIFIFENVLLLIKKTFQRESLNIWPRKRLNISFIGSIISFCPPMSSIYDCMAKICGVIHEMNIVTCISFEIYSWLKLRIQILFKRKSNQNWIQLKFEILENYGLLQTENNFTFLIIK